MLSAHYKEKVSSQLFITVTHISENNSKDGDIYLTYAQKVASMITWLCCLWAHGGSVPYSNGGGQSCLAHGAEGSLPVLTSSFFLPFGSIWVGSPVNRWYDQLSGQIILSLR